MKRIHHFNVMYRLEDRYVLVSSIDSRVTSSRWTDFSDWWKDVVRKRLEYSWGHDIDNAPQYIYDGDWFVCPRVMGSFLGTCGQHVSQDFDDNFFNEIFNETVIECDKKLMKEMYDIEQVTAPRQQTKKRRTKR
jgi:hypothetical protein